MMAPKNSRRATRQTDRSQERNAAMGLGEAEATGIIGGVRPMLPRNGMAAAADLPRDLAAAFQFSRYAERLRSAEPGLVGDVLAAIEHPWRWHERAQHGLADAPHAEALASGLRDLRRRVFLTVL